MSVVCVFFNDTATTEIYTLSLHDALPICDGKGSVEDVLDNVLLASSLPFSVETSPTFDLPVCIKSRGNSRNANATISCSTSDSSDSKVIWVLFGREIDTLTMVTLSRLL